MVSTTQGARGASIAYGADGLPSSITDGLTQTLGFSYDAVGRRTALQTPDGRQILFGRDKNGKLTSVTPPGDRRTPSPTTRPAGSRATRRRSPRSPR